MSTSSGPPYPPAVALVGGVPSVPVDVPICSVFLVLFLAGAISHMGLFKRNMKKKHKFIPSAVTFGFCMSRIVANSVRIAWAVHPHNVSLGIAAQIFVYAGVVLLFILNLIYAQRMLRAAHPHIGWSLPVSLTFKALYILIVLSIIMVITVTVQSSYTLNANTHRIDRDIQLYGTTYFAIVSFLPLPIVAFVLLYPRRNKRIEKFGKGSWRAKAVIICMVAILLCLGASFRAGTSWENPRRVDDPAWYDNKAAFYCFNFVIEIIVVYVFLFVRMDQRFHVPNGSSKVRHYRGDSFPDLQVEQTNPQLRTEATEEEKKNNTGSPRDVESGGSMSEIPIASRKEEPGMTVDSLASSRSAGVEVKEHQQV